MSSGAGAAFAAAPDSLPLRSCRRKAGTSPRSEDPSFSAAFLPFSAALPFSALLGAFVVGASSEKSVARAGAAPWGRTVVAGSSSERSLARLRLRTVVLRSPMKVVARSPVSSNSDAWA